MPTKKELQNISAWIGAGLIALILIGSVISFFNQTKYCESQGAQRIKLSATGSAFCMTDEGKVFPIK
jgi:hypothetical protein